MTKISAHPPQRTLDASWSEPMKIGVRQSRLGQSTYIFGGVFLFAMEAIKGALARALLFALSYHPSAKRLTVLPEPAHSPALPHAASSPPHLSAADSNHSAAPHV